MRRRDAEQQAGKRSEFRLPEAEQQAGQGPRRKISGLGAALKDGACRPSAAGTASIGHEVARSKKLLLGMGA